MDALVNTLANADLEDSVHTEDEECSTSTSSEEEEDYLSSSDSDSDENDSDIPYDDESTDTDTESTESSASIHSDEEEEETTSNNKRKREDPNKWVREVRHYQKTPDLILPRSSFQRLVREIAQDFAPVSFTQSAFDALQTATEDMATDLFKVAQVSAINRNQQIIMPKDFQMARFAATQFNWKC